MTKLEKLEWCLIILDRKLDAIIDLLANDKDKQRIQNDIDYIYKNIIQIDKEK